MAARRTAFEVVTGEGVPERRAAELVGVPRSTVRHWLWASGDSDMPAAVAAFLSSADGTAWIRMVVLAAHMEFCQRGTCGVDRVCSFLKRIGVDRFVASSHGAQHKIAVEIEELLGTFAEEQTARLALDMPEQLICAAEDETFKQGMCLVAGEPVSGFTILKRRSEKRDAAAWNEAMAKATTGLKVKIIQVVSDGAKGLIGHTCVGLGAHHSPDLFHVEHDMAKALVLALKARAVKAAQQLELAEKRTANWLAHKTNYWANPRSPGRPPAFDARIAAAQAAQAEAATDLQAAQARRIGARDAIRQMSQSYHPYDLQTGAPRSPDVVHSELLDIFNRLDRIAQDIGLSPSCRKLLAKARRVVPKMVQTLAFYGTCITAALAPLALEADLERVVRLQLIPGLYLELVARRAKLAKHRHAVRATSQRLLAQARAPDGLLAALAPGRLAEIERVAAVCANFFQRSSSCIEGDNGQLALCLHAFHRLSDRKLAALVAIHNFYIRRPDGSTAAERFFGASHPDPFDWILFRLGSLPRPATRPAPILCLPLAA